jgi:hypothetical protein
MLTLVTCDIMLVVKVSIKNLTCPHMLILASAQWPHSYILTSVLKEEGRFINSEGDSFLTLDDRLDKIGGDVFAVWLLFVQAQSPATNWRYLLSEARKQAWVKLEISTWVVTVPRWTAEGRNLAHTLWRMCGKTFKEINTRDCWGRRYAEFTA